MLGKNPSNSEVALVTGGPHGLWWKNHLLQVTNNLDDSEVASRCRELISAVLEGPLYMESIYEDISGNIIDQLGLVLSEQIDAIRIRVKNCNGEERMLSPYSASTGSRVFGYIFKKRNTGAYYRLVNLGPNSNVGNEVVAQLEELPK